MYRDVCQFSFKATHLVFRSLAIYLFITVFLHNNDLVDRFFGLINFFYQLAFQFMDILVKSRRCKVDMLSIQKPFFF